MADPQVRDFSAQPQRPRAQTQAAGSSFARSQSEPDIEAQQLPRRHTTLYKRQHAASPTHARAGSAESADAADNRASIDTLRRRPTRSNTVRQYHSPTRAHFEEPGAEPGIDPSKEDDVNGPLHKYSLLQQYCDITIVDFSDDKMVQHEVDNNTLGPFLEQPKEDWVSCRWVNVNGLSWDVIKLIGNDKNLHRLAVEDMLNTRNRTKADWYSDHAFSKYQSVFPIFTGTAVAIALLPYHRALLAFLFKCFVYFALVILPIRQCVTPVALAESLFW
jgi:hypothetical protein